MQNEPSTETNADLDMRDYARLIQTRLQRQYGDDAEAWMCRGCIYIKTGWSMDGELVAEEIEDARAYYRNL